MNATPIVFASEAGPCFGWHHAPQGAARNAVAVFCAPMGWEAICAYRTSIQFAHALTLQGFDVLRFDWHGTGESAGGEADPDRVAAWLGSLRAAIGEARRLRPGARIALVGVRLGATLAAHFASIEGGVDAAVLWAPVPSGRALVRELRASALQAPAPGATDLVSLGCLYTAQTLDALQGIQLDRAQRAPAPRVLFIPRDDLPGEGPLPRKYRELGAQVDVETWPGYASMMNEPHKAVLDPDLPGRIAGWLAAALPAQPAADALPTTLPAELISAGVREQPVGFGDAADLFGVTAEPAGAGAQQAQTGVILVNVAGTYRVGPNRIYVKLSRALASAGYRVMRFDLPGIGDSRTHAGLSPASLYNRHSTADVRAAIDVMLARGCKKIWLLGICSGSYVAFNTALGDPRVNGVVMMNSRLLEWNAGTAGSWENAMTRAAYKSTTYYRRAMLSPEVYLRMLKGQVDVRGIASRFATLVSARLNRLGLRLIGRGGEAEGVLPKMKQLTARGTDVLLVMSAHDDGLDYIEFHLGAGGHRMRGERNFRFVTIEDSDHTFSPLESQRQVIDTVRRHLDSKLGQDAPSANPLAPRIATT